MLSLTHGSEKKNGRVLLLRKEYERLETLVPSGEGNELTSRGRNGALCWGKDACEERSTNWAGNKLSEGGDDSWFDLFGLKYGLSWSPPPPTRAYLKAVGCQSWALPSWLRRLLPPDVNVQWTTSWLKQTGACLLCQSGFVLQPKEVIKECTVQESKRNSVYFHRNHTVNVKRTNVNDPPGYIGTFIKCEGRHT